MIVDIGGGTTEVAVISFSGIVESRSVRVGGDEMDIAISQHLKRAHNLMVGPRTAEDIKIQIGSAYPQDENTTIEVRGNDLISRLPKTIKISEEEIRIALQEPIASIVESVKATLEHCPPELAADLIDRGIMLAGGGALLKGIDKLLTEETGLPVFVAEEPLQAVARGTGIALQEIDTVHRARTSSVR
jgi:rod shape-determining protein MreB